MVKLVFGIGPHAHTPPPLKHGRHTSQRQFVGRRIQLAHHASARQPRRLLQRRPLVDACVSGPKQGCEQREHRSACPR